MNAIATAHYHLPGLFEFYDLYKAFLPLYREHREYFYDWCDIGSIYGAPADCLWGGGRVGYGDADSRDVCALLKEYDISPRLTFSNSLLKEEHLKDHRCNQLCDLFVGKLSTCGTQVHNQSASGQSADEVLFCGRQSTSEPQTNNRHNTQPGVIVHSDLLLDYLKTKYPNFYFVSSTTKVQTDFNDFKEELDRPDFTYVVPDFRLNHDLEHLATLTDSEKDKVEFLMNECCWTGCQDRKACYETVSRMNLGDTCPEHVCTSPNADNGYTFSRAMENPTFIGLDDIQNTYLPMGFTNFKIEGRSLGSAIVLEMLLYYMVKPECQLKVREAIYLDSMLDLF